MTKLMTVDLIFGELKEGRLKEDDTFNVSEHAWRTGGAPAGGSAMYAEIHSDVAVHDLLRGLIVQSGNDAAIVLAEGVAGSEPAFVDRMNQRAAELGMTNSHFATRTACTIPTSSSRRATSPRSPPHHPRIPGILSDLLRAGIHLEQDPPDQPQSDGLRRHRRRRAEDRLHQGIRLRHYRLGGAQRPAADSCRRRPRLRSRIARRRRSGSSTGVFAASARSPPSRRTKSSPRPPSMAASHGRVPLKAERPDHVLVPRDAKDALKARVIYQGPLMAPVEEGAEVGSFKVWNGDRLIQETPLYTAAAVAARTAPFARARCARRTPVRLAVRGRGRFITLEGGEGAGKSGHAARLAEWLRRAGGRGSPHPRAGRLSARGGAARTCSSPGISKRRDAETEALVFALARADHLATKIRPALAAGTLGDLRPLHRIRPAPIRARPAPTPKLLDLIDAIVVGDDRPDLTLILDVPAALGLERARKKKPLARPLRERGAGAARGAAAGLPRHRRARAGALRGDRRDRREGGRRRGDPRAPSRSA